VPVHRISRLPVVLLALLLGNALVHVGLGWVLGLSGDEAHYALYAAHPALSYYDHPPLVGWVQWPLVALGAPDGVLRLVPEALWLATALFVYDIARRLRGQLVPADHAGITADTAGLWAVLAYSLAPVLHVLGIGLLPDTLLMFFTAALLWQTLRMLDVAEVQRLPAWLLLGVLLGLAGLAKYTAIFAALPVAACLLAAHGGRLLRRPAPWLALGLAVALVLPVFVWNAQNGWISFAYQLHHGAGSHWQWQQMAGFLLAQGLLYPLLLWGVFGLRRSVLGGTGLHRPQAWLLAFFAVPFAVLAYLSGGGSSLPHWTAPAWVALAPFAGVGLAALWVGGRRRLVWALGGLQAFFTLALYVLMLLAGPTWLQAAEPGSSEAETINPFTDFYGWDAAGAKAQQLARETQTPRLVVQNWTLASRLAWYARPLPVHVIAPGFDQFSLWSGELPVGADAVLLDWSQMAYRLPVGEGMFQRCEPLDTLVVARAGRPVARFGFYHCRGWAGRPAPRRLGEP
jgi:4-amino-4-deoxy-L-arabinose transferase-like glycosyltransferase